MHKIIIGLIALTVYACSPSSPKESNMEQVKIVELVVWKFNEGISIEEGKELAKQLNYFVKTQPGFIARKTSVSEDGKFLDVVYWTDLESAQKASEKAMQNEALAKVFSTMDQESMIFQHFEVFNSVE